MTHLLRIETKPTRPRSPNLTSSTIMVVESSLRLLGITLAKVKLKALTGLVSVLLGGGCGQLYQNQLHYRLFDLYLEKAQVFSYFLVTECVLRSFL
ncbi:hypothetical protein V6N13_086988 [Hibiscus sabdariffa]|uniref:Uncharacterized protein n=1 Tax=Hibiscus sabdariffa TaxID=183260 RepID=A0ABR2FUV1_9ROSI